MARIQDISRTMINGFGEDHILRPLVEYAIRKDENRVRRLKEDGSIDSLYQRAISIIWRQPIFTIIGENTRREVSQAELANKLKLLYSYDKEDLTQEQRFCLISTLKYLNRVGRNKNYDQTFMSWNYLTQLNRNIRALR